ncbi:MAG TPA: aldo/keto reductase [Gammaproteobacteria bacterium]|nr:aldo/keto reductase [Gammaproteobacteria bacterium]
MEYRRLGQSGLKLSCLSLGSWVTFGNQVDRGAAENMLAHAYDAGVNFFDSAESYGRGAAEEILGGVLRKLAWPRDTWCVSSKVYFGSVSDPMPTQRGLSRKHVVEACHEALRRLQVDYLDLYFCHRPDPDTPIEETVRTMDELVRQGKVLYWGTSEWPADSIAEAYRLAREHCLTPPTMEQPEYNLFTRDRVEKEYAALYREYGLGTTIWSPLKSGLLTGKYNHGIPDDSRLNLASFSWLKESVLGPDADARVAAVQKLADIAERLGVSMTQFAIAWCLANAHVSTVILGASRLEQLQENLGAAEVRLDADVMAEVDRALSHAS